MGSSEEDKVTITVEAAVTEAVEEEEEQGEEASTGERRGEKPNDDVNDARDAGGGAGSSKEGWESISSGVEDITPPPMAVKPEVKPPEPPKLVPKVEPKGPPEDFGDEPGDILGQARRKARQKQNLGEEEIGHANTGEGPVGRPKSYGEAGTKQQRPGEKKKMMTKITDEGEQIMRVNISVPVPPSKSKCHSLPGYKALDKPPIRSPLVVADALIQLVEGKRYYEIGTRKGDHVKCIKPFAKKAHASEIDKQYCSYLRKNNITVVCEDFMKSDELPEPMQRANVIFWWPPFPNKNEPWLTRIVEGMEKSEKPALIRNKVIVIAFDHNWFGDKRSLRTLKQKWCGLETIFKFNEGRQKRQRGQFSLMRFRLEGIRRKGKECPYYSES